MISENNGTDNKGESEFLMFNKIDKRVSKMPDRPLNKGQIKIGFDANKTAIFGKIIELIKTDKYISKLDIAAGYADRFDIINMMHPRIFYFNDLNLKILLLNNEDDEKIDPDDNESFYSSVVLYLNISDHILNGDRYIEEQWKEIRKSIIVSYLLKLDDLELKESLIEYYLYHMSELFFKNPSYLPLSDVEKILVERCIIWLLESMPYTIFKNGLSNDNVSWKNNIKLGSVLNYIYEDSPFYKHSINKKAVDIPSYEDDNNEIDKIKMKLGMNKDKQRMTFLELDEFLANTFIESRYKDVLYIAVKNLRLMYCRLFDDILYIENLKKRNFNTVLRSIKVNNETKLGTTINKHLGPEFILELYNTHKYSNIERFKRWHEITRNRNRTTNYLIKVSEIILLIEYNSANESNYQHLQPPIPIESSNNVDSDEESLSKKERSTIFESGNANSRFSDEESLSKKERSPIFESGNANSRFSDEKLENNIILNKDVDINSLLGKSVSENDLIVEQLMKMLELEFGKDDKTSINDLVPSHIKNVHKYVDLLKSKDPSTNAKQSFYKKHYLEFRDKYNCRYVNNVLKTDWTSILLFMMTSNYISLLQKNLFAQYLNCYNNFIESWVDSFYGGANIGKFTYEDQITYSMITSINRKPKN